MTIRALKDGDGVGAAIMVDGQPTIFSLALFGRKSFFRGEESYEFGFVNLEKGLYIDGFYSGGNTGMGRDVRDMGKLIHEDDQIWVVSRYDEENKKEKRFLETDLEKIQKIAHEEELRELDERAADLQTRRDRVARINALPKTFKTNIALPVDYEYERSEAEFNPTRSSIQWRLTIVIGSEKKNFYPDNYVTKSGAVQERNFAKDMPRIFGEAASRAMSPKVIREMVKEYNDLKKSIQNA